MQQIVELRNKVTPTEFGSANHYDLKSLGIISKQIDSKQWYRLSGKAINGTMPWLTDLLEILSPLNPDDGSVSYMNGDGAAHIDQDAYKSALNYIFDNTDDLAYTWIEHDGTRYTYDSKVGDAWLLDTHKLHGIKNTGERWTLSIHFNCDYETVKQWFENSPKLVFGEINK